MKTIFYPKLHEKNIFGATISNSGEEAIICGKSIKLLDLVKGRIIQNIGRFSNAVVTFSHNQSIMFVVNAAAKGTVTLAQYVRSNNIYQEITKVHIKGFNTDGGKPFFSENDQLLIFCTDSKKVWCYDRIVRACKCLYQVQHPDQYLTLDLSEDQLLITLNSSMVTEHNGFDILDSLGNCKKRFRYNNPLIESLILRAKWIDSDKFIVIYPNNAQNYDCYQIISCAKCEQLSLCDTDKLIDRPGKALYDVLVSPSRKYVVFVWLDFSNSFMRVIEIYDKSLNKLIYQYTAQMYFGISFSQDDRYCFVCSEDCIWIDLQE